jgi:hypothetical protein
MSVRALLDPVACHARLACSLSLGAAHKASLRLLTTTAPNASFLHGPLANGAAGENNQKSPGADGPIAVAALAGARNI